MVAFDWSRGFRIESDGTTEGTKVYDANGEQVPYLKYFELRFSVDKELPFIEAQYTKIPFEDADTEPDIELDEG